MTDGADAFVVDDAFATPRAPSRLRRRLEYGWVVTVVLFTLGRLLVAQGTLAQYGLNIWVFGIIDLVTAFPYALGTAKVVGAVVDRDGRAIGTWAAVAAGAFLAPYLYVAWAGTGGAFPPAVYIALAILIVAFGANAIWSVFRKVRLARVARVARAAELVAQAEGTDGAGDVLTNPARS